MLWPPSAPCISAARWLSPGLQSGHSQSGIPGTTRRHFQGSQLGKGCHYQPTMHRMAPTVKNDPAQGASRVKVGTPLWGQAAQGDSWPCQLPAGGREDPLVRQMAPWLWAAL